MKNLLLLAGFLFIIHEAIKQKNLVSGIGKITKTPILPPYNEKGKTNFRFTEGKTGVYLIYENGKLVYVGYSDHNLYKTMYRHFQTWNSYQKVVSYSDRMTVNKYLIRVALTNSRAESERLERGLIILYQPRDNTFKYEAFKSDKNIIKKTEEYFSDIPQPSNNLVEDF